MSKAPYFATLGDNDKFLFLIASNDPQINDLKSLSTGPSWGFLLSISFLFLVRMIKKRI